MGFVSPVHNSSGHATVKNAVEIGIIRRLRREALTPLRTGATLAAAAQNR
jgi:hypothetical protein